MKKVERFVLVVEDNDDHRKYVTIVLQNAGLTVLTPIDAQHGLELLDSHDIESIVADVDIENGKAADILRLIKTSDRQIPLTVMTCCDVSPTQARAMGATRLLRKPIESVLLVESVRSCRN